MKENSFILKYSKKVLGFYFVFDLLIFGFWMFSLMLGYHLIINIYAIIFFILLIYLITSYVFWVQIGDTKIKVRNRIGRNYQFDISEIKKIEVYYEQNSVFLRIFTDIKLLKLDVGLEEFDKLARYLIDECKNNNLKNSVISEDCFLYLMTYCEEYIDENKFNVTIKKCK